MAATEATGTITAAARMRRPFRRQASGRERGARASEPRRIIGWLLFAAFAGATVGCGGGRGDAGGEAGGSVDIGGREREPSPVADNPASPSSPAADERASTAVSLAAPTDPPFGAPADPPTAAPAGGDGDGGGNLEIIDVPDDDIEQLLDATGITFGGATIEEICLLPGRFAARITGGPQVIVSEDVRLATRVVVAVLGFPPGAPIEVRVADPNGDEAAAVDLAADGNGCAVGRWIVSPERPVGDYLVYASDGNVEAILPVPVAQPDGPRLVVAPNEVVAGDVVTVSLAGYPADTRLELVLYTEGRGPDACGDGFPGACWRFRQALRTGATDGRGGLVVRLPTARDDAGERFLVTTNPRPEMFPQDVQNEDLMFRLVDRQRSEITPEALPTYTFEEAVPTAAAPPWLRPRGPRWRDRLATPVVAP